MITPELEAKVERLIGIIKEMNRFVLALSGGVDSSLLLKVSHDVLNQGVLPVTGVSETFVRDDLKRAKDMTKTLGLRHIIVNTTELSKKEFVENTPLRCYYCKKSLFEELFRIAKDNGMRYVVDGTNYDDREDYRPGHLCGMEMGVRFPLMEARLTKTDIRQLSAFYRLPEPDRPASPCLASRFPYGVPITYEGLRRVSEGEHFLRSFGFEEVRVRHHDNLVRIEIRVEQLDEALRLRREIVQRMKEIGYIYVSLDLQGFRSGSSNEVLPNKGV